MGLPNIALMGRARAGKDTVAGHLIRKYQYTRVAFADPLKEMALSVDPWIEESDWYDGGRLSELVAFWGWEKVKDQWPDARRFLQNLGAAVRARDPYFWITEAEARIIAANKWNLPIVITDVRYPNEASYLESAGFEMVRILRPSGKTRAHASKLHESETALDDYMARNIMNDGSEAKLFAQVDRLIAEVRN